MKKIVKNISEAIIRVVLYIRVSTEEQVKHGYSLQAQRERLIEYCKQKGYQVIEIYVDEGKSARSKLKNRTELLRLIEDAKLKKFDRIIFWRLDRWFRNIADYYKVQEILEANKIDWECSDEEYSTTTSNGRLHLNIKLSIAQNESDQTSDRIKFNFDNMVKNGRAITGNQGVPLGYMVAGEEKNKKVVKNPETEQIAIDMLEYVKKTGSVRKTVIYINEKYNLKICYDSMRHYLMNEKYYGYYRGIENYCEPYITKQEFEEIQSLVKRNVKNNKKYDYIFSGLLKCPKCGCKLSGYQQMSTKPKYNRKYKYPSYRCKHTHNDKLCNYHKYPHENVIEQYMINNIKSEMAKLIKNSETSQEENKIKINKLDKEKIKARLSRLMDLYLDGMVLREKYDQEFEKLNLLLQESEKQIIEEKRDLSQYKEFLKSDALSIYNKLNNSSKRMFWAKYIDYIILNEDGTYEIKFK